MAAYAATTNSFVGDMSVNHALVIKEGGALCNIASWSIRNQLVAGTNAVQVQSPASAGVSGESPADIRGAKERALAKAAALDSMAALPPVRQAAPFAPPPAVAETNHVAATATNMVTRLLPIKGKAPASPLAPSSAKSRASDELKALADQARDLYNRKQYKEAAVKYREVLKRDPENLFGLSNLAVIRFQQGQIEEAEHLLNRALQIAPDDGYAHATIGTIYLKQDRIDEAIEELTLAIKFNPDNAEAHNFLGIACWKKGWSSAAEKELHRAIEISANYADAHYNLVLIYTSKKMPFSGFARFHYRKTLEFGHPRDPDLEKLLFGGE